MSTSTPDRIEPFYKTDHPDQEIPLLEYVEATIKQGQHTVTGKLSMTQEWSPMALKWRFADADMSNLTIGEVEIVSKSFKAAGYIYSAGKHLVSGYVQGEVEVGTDHKLDVATFHLTNYPSFMSSQGFSEISAEGSSAESRRWHEVVLEFDPWIIKIQPCTDTFKLRQEARERQGVILNGVGTIRRVDGAKFHKKRIKPLLRVLKVFLSFAFGEWSPPLLVVGSNSVAKKSCQFWANHDLSSYGYMSGWIDEHNNQYLAHAFPNFMRRWSQGNWQEPLELSVAWLIEASRRTRSTEGAIAFGQIPLEMFAWLVFVNDRTIVESGEFEKLSAASKLQMLLSHCEIPLAVPTSLEGLTKVVLGLKSKTPKLMSGPQIATRIRNSIIHPHKSNRSMLAEWESKYWVKTSDIRWECRQLFKWYITLVLLRLIDYSGKYANRLTPYTLGNLELVPWAQSQEDPSFGEKQ